MDVASTRFHTHASLRLGSKSISVTRRRGAVPRAPALDRLARNVKNRFCSQDYAAEELIAELTSAVLCAEFGFDGEVRHAG